MGWNGSENKSAAPVPKKTVKTPPSKWRGLIALLVIVAGGIAAWIALRPAAKEIEEGAPAKPMKISEVKPQIATNQVEVAEKTEDSSPKAKPEKPQKDLGTVFVAHTAKDGRVMTLMDGTVVTNRSKVIFTRDFEQALLIALRPGGMVNSLFARLRRKYTDSQIMAMLQEMTIPTEDDDEGTAACKRNVQNLKEQMLLEIKDGRTVSEVLEDVRRQCYQERRVKLEAMRARREALRTKDPETIRDVYESSNKILKEGGLPTVRVPDKYAAKSEESGGAGADLQKTENESKDEVSEDQHN